MNSWLFKQAATRTRISITLSSMASQWLDTVASSQIVCRQCNRTHDLIRKYTTISLPCVVHPCYIPVNHGAAPEWAYQSVDGCGKHSSGVDNCLHVVELSFDLGFLVQVCQDVHPRHILPAGAAALQQQGLGGGRRRDGVREYVILKHVALVSSIFMFQQRHQLQPTGNRMMKRIHITNLFKHIYIEKQYINY